MQTDLIGEAGYSPPPAFLGVGVKKETAAQANGRRYQDKAFGFLRAWAHHNQYEIKVNPWIKYRDVQGQVKYCQPDVVLLSLYDDNCIIVEVKLRHTRDAVVQLLRYGKLIALIHPEYKPCLVELCRYFDHSEYPMELMHELRPHSFPYAAVVFDPRTWTPATN